MAINVSFSDAANYISDLTKRAANKVTSSAKTVWQPGLPKPPVLTLGNVSPRVAAAQKAAEPFISDAQKQYKFGEAAAQVPRQTVGKTLEGLQTLFEKPGLKQVAQAENYISQRVGGGIKEVREHPLSDTEKKFPITAIPRIVKGAIKGSKDISFEEARKLAIDKGFSPTSAIVIGGLTEIAVPGVSDIGNLGKVGRTLQKEASIATDLGKVARSGEEIVSKFRQVAPEPATAGKTIENWWTKFKTGIVTKYAGLDPVESTLYTRNNKPVPSLRLSRVLEQSPGDTGKATADVQQFYNNVVRRIPDGQYNNFDVYLKLRRAQDRLTTDPKLRKIGNLTIEEANAGLAALQKEVGPDNFKAFEVLGNGPFQDLADKALRLQVDSGRMSESLYKAIKDSNEFYAPYNVMRSLENIEGASSSFAKTDAIAGTKALTKKIKGIGDDQFFLGDSIQAMAEQIYRSRLLAEKNNKMLQVRKLAQMDTSGEFFQFTRRSEDVQRRIELYKQVKDVLHNQVYPMTRELRASRKIDRATQTRLTKIEKEYESALTQMEDEFGAFMNGEQKIQQFVPEARQFKTLPNELAYAAKQAKQYTSAEAFDKSKVLLKEHEMGTLQRLGFNTRKEFWRYVTEGYIKTPEKTVEKTKKGVTPIQLARTQKKIEIAQRNKDLVSNLDKRSIEDNIRFLEKSLEDRKSQIASMREEARKLADQKVPNGYEKVSYFHDGIVEQIAMKPELAKVLVAQNPHQVGLISKMGMLAKAPTMMGATGLNLTFQVVNLLFADFPRLALVFRFGPRVLAPKDWMKFPFDFTYSFYSSLRGNFGVPNKMYEEFIKSGASSTTVQRWLTPSSFERELSLAPKSLQKRIGLSLIDSLPRFSNAIEETSKIAGLKMGKRFVARGSTTEAELITEIRNFAGSPDFWRMGTHGREMNILFLFLNARIQGSAADFARLAGKAEGGAKASFQTWLKLTAVVGTPALTLAMLNKQDEYKDDYNKRAQWEKENYFLIPREQFYFDENGDRQREYWRIPKRETVKLFANMIEASVDFAEKHDPQALGRFGVSILENASPVNISGQDFGQRAESVMGSLNPAIKAPAEFFGNRDFFRHQPTVSRYKQGLPPKDQYSASTPKIFVKLGEKLNTSPAKLFQLFRNFGGEAINQFVVPPDEGRGLLPRLPVTRRFVGSTTVQQPGIDRNLKLLQEQEGLSFESKQKAILTYEELRKMPPAEANKRIQEIQAQDKELYKKVVDLYKDEKSGLGFEGRLLKQLGVTNGFRAARIVEMIMALPPEKRNDFWATLVAQKIATKEVAAQVQQYISQMKEASQQQSTSATPQP